jgi:hypothetical protein
MGDRRKVVWGRRVLLAAVLVLGAPALAGPEGGGEEPGSEERAAEQRLRLFGRLYARVSADEREDYARALGIESARVGVSASLPHLEAELSAELSSKSLLKDAYVRLADGRKRLRLYGGQFKAPFLARALESSWGLPLMRRGVVEDWLVDTQRMGGRRPGLMGELRLKEAWQLKVSGGVFQGAKDEETGQRTGEDAALRASVRPHEAFTLGASTYLAEVFAGTRRHAVAADATLRLGGLELSGEYVRGQLAQGPFTAQLALASFTLPLGEDGWALQPLAGAEALQLRGPLRARGYSWVGGLNLLLLDHFKAQLQAERALRAGDEAPGLEYSLQFATRF